MSTRGRKCAKVTDALGLYVFGLQGHIWWTQKQGPHAAFLAQIHCAYVVPRKLTSEPLQRRVFADRCNSSPTISRMDEYDDHLNLHFLFLLLTHGFYRNSAFSSDYDDENVELADLKIVTTLGVGGFGRVKLVKHFYTEKVDALKILSKAHVVATNQCEHVLNQRNILISAKCDFVVR